MDKIIFVLILGTLCCSLSVSAYNMDRINFEIKDDKSGVNPRGVIRERRSPFILQLQVPTPNFPGAVTLPGPGAFQFSNFGLARPNFMNIFSNLSNFGSLIRRNIFQRFNPTVQYE